MSNPPIKKVVASLVKPASGAGSMLSLNQYIAPENTNKLAALFPETFRSRNRVARLREPVHSWQSKPKTRLMALVALGHVDRVKKELQDIIKQEEDTTGPGSLLELVNRWGRPPRSNTSNILFASALYYAIKSGNRDLIQAFLEFPHIRQLVEGQKIIGSTKSDHRRITPIGAALEIGDIELVNIFLDLGAIPTIEDLQDAVRENSTRIVQRFLTFPNVRAHINDPVIYRGSYGEKLTVLNTAINMNNLEIVRLLLDAGAEVGQLLELAIDSNNLPLVKLLVERGADINAVNGLHLALEKKFLNIMRFLGNNGADVNKLDKYNNTPLKLAVMYGEPNVEIKFLLSKGANPKQPYYLHGKPRSVYMDVLEAYTNAKHDLEDPNTNNEGEYYTIFGHLGHPEEIIEKYGAILKLFDLAEQGRLQNAPTAAAGTARGGHRKQTRRFRLKRRKTVRR